MVGQEGTRQDKTEGVAQQNSSLVVKHTWELKNLLWAIAKHVHESGLEKIEW